MFDDVPEYPHRWLHPLDTDAVASDTEVVEVESPLMRAMHESLQAKLERLLRRPLIADVVAPPAPEPEPEVELPSFFRLAQQVTLSQAPTEGVRRAASAWREEEDGTWTVRIDIDYADLWRGAEKEVLELVNGTVENAVTFLTDEQRRLLERSPREFLALMPRPEIAELVSFRKETIGGVERVVELTVAERPRTRDLIRSIAVVPNLVPLERQRAALHTLAHVDDEGPLAPLRALVGLSPAPAPADGAALPSWSPPAETRLDAFQSACVRKAMQTPSFAVIKGPPGSGKTTVITTIIRQTLERGGRVLVVSPTHVAVDNVVEKLVASATAPDTLDPSTLPVRYAAREKRLLPAAAPYWVGPKKQKRAATIAKRLEKALVARSPVVRAAFADIDPEATGHAPLSEALAAVQGVICGTPIGLLSYDVVKTAEPGAFDLLVVDEVSKMTLPEFLAVAVKAKRWVLVGDPEQLPPFNHAEENGATLDDVLSPELELVTSVGTLVERLHPEKRRSHRLLVVAREPTTVAAAAREHLRDVDLLATAPPIATFESGARQGIVVCRPEEVDDAAAHLSPAWRRDLTRNPGYHGGLDILVERGLRVPRPAFASGTRLVEARFRAPAVIFETAFSVYHAQPWALRAAHRLRLVAFRNGLGKSLPSTGALRALSPTASPEEASERRQDLVHEIALRFAVNTVSVFDWLTGIPSQHFDTSPLTELTAVSEPLSELKTSVRPFIGTLERQYRMHGSLSKVPRELFYFGEALADGLRERDTTCRAVLVQVQPDGPEGESNRAEAAAIVRTLGEIARGRRSNEPTPSVLVITPYREQERVLLQHVDAMHGPAGLAGLDVEVCTLDRCQGREADYVFISLVRSKATTFLDAPKRWNVALTRAKNGLFLVGDIDAYLSEAQRDRTDSKKRDDIRPRTSLLARILEAYDHQIHGTPSHSTRSSR